MHGATKTLETVSKMCTAYKMLVVRKMAWIKLVISKPMVVTNIDNMPSSKPEATEIIALSIAERSRRLDTSR